MCGGVACNVVSVQGVCSELALVDVAGDKLRAEKMDLADGQAFMKHRIKVSADTGTVRCTARCINDEHWRAVSRSCRQVDRVNSRPVRPHTRTLQHRSRDADM